MVSAVHECKLVFQCRTSSGPCLTMIRVLSRSVYEARDETRRECIIRDTTRVRFGNRTAASHDSGSKQLTRDDLCGDIPTSYFSYRSCPRDLILVPYMPTSVNSYPADTATVEVSVTTHARARVLVRRASSPRPTTRVPFTQGPKWKAPPCNCATCSRMTTCAGSKGNQVQLPSVRVSR